MVNLRMEQLKTITQHHHEWKDFQDTLLLFTSDKDNLVLTSPSNTNVVKIVGCLGESTYAKEQNSPC
jgi:hypothetical protein